jgi:hypothetical protein
VISYKIAIWFEFQDDNTSFNGVSATLEHFKTTGNTFKLAALPLQLADPRLRRHGGQLHQHLQPRHRRQRPLREQHRRVHMCPGC